MASPCYFTFPTTFFALKAERVLNNTACAFKLVPVPRAISTSCGIALRCSGEEVEPIKTVFKENDVSFSDIHNLNNK